MINLNENQNSGSKKISWIQIVNAVVQAIIAALTALGVSSCASAINSL
ncbi:MAG: smalltalk protein [Prevotella sp.]